MHAEVVFKNQNTRFLAHSSRSAYNMLCFTKSNTHVWFVGGFEYGQWNCLCMGVFAGEGGISVMETEPWRVGGSWGGGNKNSLVKEKKKIKELE